jgi:hypothetical protein
VRIPFSGAREIVTKLIASLPHDQKFAILVKFCSTMGYLEEGVSKFNSLGLGEILSLFYTSSKGFSFFFYFRRLLETVGGE